jgi:hypothetical protein
MRYVALVLLVIFSTIGLDALIPRQSAEAERGEGCACRELQVIRRILELSFRLECNASRCLPAPNPTQPNGGPLE